MTGADSRTGLVAPVEGYLTRIDAHLTRLLQGHDPLGHLFAIERLARVARSEWREAQRQAGSGAPRQ